MTDDEILVGIALPDIGRASEALGVSGSGAGAIGDRRIWEAFIEAANVHAPHGRRIRPIFTTYDLTDNADTLRACNELTEDHQVFAVLTYTFFGDAARCVTVQHETLLLNIDGQPDDVTRESGGRLFTVFMSKNRILQAQALGLDRRGFLEGRTVGVLASQFGYDDVPVRQTLLPLLRELGHEPAVVSTFANDVATAQAQLPVEVAKMRQAGVDVIFAEINSIALMGFSQEADRQLYHPFYLTSDFAGSNGEFASALYPESFAGAGITAFRAGEQRVGLPEPETDAWCRSIWESAGGARYERTSGEYATVLQECALVMQMLLPGLLGAGRGLSTESFSNALQQTGSFQMAYASSASFAPGKFDAPDQVRANEFRNDCNCWVPIDDFGPAE